MTRATIMDNGGLLFDYTAFKQMPALNGYLLDENTAMLAFLFLREYGTNRDSWYFEEEEDPLTGFLGLDDSEWSVVQSWYEEALRQLKTIVPLAGTGILVYPTFGVSELALLEINDTATYVDVLNPDCGERIVKLSFFDPSFNPVEIQAQITTTDWASPRSSCGLESAIFYDTSNNIISTVPRTTNPNGTIAISHSCEITCAEGRQNFTVSVQRLT